MLSPLQQRTHSKLSEQATILCVMVCFNRVKVFADNQYSALYSSLVFGESFGKRYAALFAPGQRQARKLLSVPTRLSINQSSSARQETLPAVIDQEEVNKL